MNDRATCATCKWFVPEPAPFGGKTHGECRRYPTAESVDQTYWCGEHTPKESEK